MHAAAGCISCKEHLQKLGFDPWHNLAAAVDLLFAKYAKQVKVGTICVCGWSANLESKLLAVFCSLRRLLLGTLLF